MSAFIRWVLFIPCGIFAHFLISTVIYNLQHAFNLFGAEFIFIRIFLATTCGFIIGSCIAPSPQVGRWLMLGYYLLMGGAIVFRLLGVESGVRYLTGGNEVAAMTLAAILSFFVVCEDNLRKIGRPVSEEK